MRVLAIDTATERCSVALLIQDAWIERSQDVQRGHADLVLPMVAEVLSEADIRLDQLDGIAYGRGPGGFTGVRIAVSTVQGLAFAAQLPTAGISNLAAVAQQVAAPGDRVLVCMDARMGEVYCAEFARGATEVLIAPVGPERVVRPEAVESSNSITRIAGTGLKAYPQLAAAWSAALQQPDVLPRAHDIALLGAAALSAGNGVPAWDAQPVYLRDRVVDVR
jgi:tRNA threonylcarbamoyladenosine biosynthesis protein TsaB